VPLERHRFSGDPGAFVERLEGLLRRIHSRGVSHGEIRLANVLAAHDDEPWLVDFTTATVVEPGRGGLVYRVQCRLDRYGWLMIKNHLLPGSLTPDERGEERHLRLTAAVLRHNVL
jgi:hypothetical protein